MRKNHYNGFFTKVVVVAVMFVMAGLFSGCKENIDDSNLYTFTGETIEDYLVNREDQFSKFNYILSRIGYDKVLSAYGTYTCFAPNNEAIDSYVDSLYNDMTKEELPHNGMTSPGLEGLTDSLCKDIALFHLLYSEVMGVDMNSGMTINTMLGRDINTSIDATTGQLVLNNFSQITSMDNELENGVLHEINHVITRSNNLMAGEMSKHEEFSLFYQALTATGLVDSLALQERGGLITPKKFCNKAQSGKIFVPKVCKYGYTIFAETDDVLKANGIASVDDMFEFAKKTYENCAGEKGWYDYYRNNGIKVSTDKDFKNPSNVLNMFIRYHIVKYAIPYNRMFYTYKIHPKAPVFEYLETMLPYTLMKLSRVNAKPRINRWVTNSTLTDRMAELASANISTVVQEGIEVGNDNIQSLNGYIHPIKGMLVYDFNVPHGVLNERLRFEDLSILPEMMSNGLRCKNPAEVKAENGGTYDTFGGNGNMRIPENFCEYLKVYNGDNTEIYYLGGQDCPTGWGNYQGDELLCLGAYDFSLRLPPVPDGTYELRIGYTGNSNRGMLQFYMGRTNSVASMQALDIPLDMRVVPADEMSADGTIIIPDAVTGWSRYTYYEDYGIATDVDMRNLNYMRGPWSFIGDDNTREARYHPRNLRRILVRQPFEQGDYWLRFKTVLPNNTNTEFHLDYIEFCPENVYNNSQYLEDMY